MAPGKRVLQGGMGRMLTRAYLRNIPPDSGDVMTPVIEGRLSTIIRDLRGLFQLDVERRAVGRAHGRDDRRVGSFVRGQRP
jgi:hypothetical protein